MIKHCKCLKSIGCKDNTPRNHNLLLATVNPWGERSKLWCNALEGPEDWATSFSFSVVEVHFLEGTTAHQWHSQDTCLESYICFSSLSHITAAPAPLPHAYELNLQNNFVPENLSNSSLFQLQQSCICNIGVNATFFQVQLHQVELVLLFTGLIQCVAHSNCSVKICRMNK